MENPLDVCTLEAAGCQTAGLHRLLHQLLLYSNNQQQTADTSLPLNHVNTFILVFFSPETCGRWHGPPPSFHRLFPFSFTPPWPPWKWSSVCLIPSKLVSTFHSPWSFFFVFCALLKTFFLSPPVLHSFFLISLSFLLLFCSRLSMKIS